MRGEVGLGKVAQQQRPEPYKDDVERSKKTVSHYKQFGLFLYIPESNKDVTREGRNAQFRDEIMSTIPR